MTRKELAKYLRKKAKNMKSRILYVCDIEAGGQDAFESLFDGVRGVRGRIQDITSSDVVLFGGGTDVNPHLYGEVPHPFTQRPDTDRDAFERQVFRRAQAVNAGCLGICRGAQFLTVVSGGKLIQHVTGHGLGNHFVHTNDGFTLNATGDHHQMMYPGNMYHTLIGWANEIGDGYCEYGKELPEREPEIVWYPDTSSLCIQAHPEWMPHDDGFPLYCRELVHKFLFGEAE